MSELKPCPFCGGEASLEGKYLWQSGGWGKSYTSYHVECKKCRTKGKYFNTIDHTNPMDKAIKAWNRRVEVTPDE